MTRLVTVATDLGPERGEVVGEQTDPATGQVGWLRVRFGDGTNSSWPVDRVTDFDKQAEVDRLVGNLRQRFSTSEWDRNTFRSDPGGYLDYTGAIPHLADDDRDAVALGAINVLFMENGWGRP